MAAILTYPHLPAEDILPSFRPPLGRSVSSGAAGVGAVYVAVGKSVEKAVTLLRWTFTAFPGQEICLLHVHRPSPLIPTLLGKLPASRANPETVAAYRHEEREEAEKLLSTYLRTCNKSRVKASVIVTEADEIQKGVVDLVNQHMIRKLVIEATPCFMKGKRSSCKTCHAARNAPSYCEIFFVNKGKLIWTRKASVSPEIVLPSPHMATACGQNLRSWSFNSGQNEVQREASQPEITLLTGVSPCDENIYDQRHGLCSSSSMSRTSGKFEYVTSAESRRSCSSSARTLGNCSFDRHKELTFEADKSNDETNVMLLEQKQLEAEALEAFDKVKALEMAVSHEVKLRVDAEGEFRTTAQEQERLLGEREKLTRQLQKTMRSIAVLDCQAHEASRRCQEVAAELRLIQASIAALHKEKLKLQEQKIEAMTWLDRWRNHEHCVVDVNGNQFVELVTENSEVLEFLLSDLEAATCDFSESFRIGRGGYGVVYKGEMLDRTVAIKKLNLHNMQRQTEFHKVVEVLSKLHHPRLVEFIGACPESWLLVYKYLPGGSLRNYLSNNHNVAILNWKTRAQIVADIAGGLLFLHSFAPTQIVHGNLKPENLLLDSEFRCKISDYGDHMLTPNQTLRCPSFRHCSGSSGAFLYTDPEYHRTGMLTYKSDIYSFGMIILQLVTGNTHGGVVAKVSRALSSGKVASVLDSFAGEWSSYAARRLLELGLQFSELNGRDRPELTPSLVKELEHLPFLEEQTVPSFFLCPILREIMHDPMVAADGFTYEGEALRGWLENGHETSPMTNLKLSHLNLIPNHSLRLAIQEWLVNLKMES
ncbi:U-box domain-containing protein 33-like [Andrographis paniculata]|uniref:U-box domain-containing protein 33-like n=1 Tax=Andrographis paniculata TaxID=175694 RepID=UPI0021E8EB55|nr:U-box domain-containing protein 33-like [Andrographis paniculata]